MTRLMPSNELCEQLDASRRRDGESVCWLSLEPCFLSAFRNPPLVFVCSDTRRRVTTVWTPLDVDVVPAPMPLAISHAVQNKAVTA